MLGYPVAREAETFRQCGEIKRIAQRSSAGRAGRNRREIKNGKRDGQCVRSEHDPEKAWLGL
jgi:hypothetical protein